MKRAKMEELYKESLRLLKERGVTPEDIADLVLFLQRPYEPDLTLERCLESIDAVLWKREVAHAILTGIALDQLAEEGKLPQPLLDIVVSDEGLYGIDEILPLSIVNLYGTIGLTSYGFLDKEKVGIIRELDTKTEHNVHTFLDDLVAAIAAAAASRIAHGEWSEPEHEL